MTDHRDQDLSATRQEIAAPGQETPTRVGRRLLLVGGTPFIVTLANRSALAGDKGGGWTQICSPSAQMSVNLSRAATLQPGQFNCGVSPGCWKQNALNQQGRSGIWQLTGEYDPTDSFASIFSLPANSRWKVSGSSTDLFAALAQQMILKYKLANNTYVEMPGGTVAHFVASLLNAAAWGQSGHYPHTPGQVLANVVNLWTKGADPTPFTQSAQPTTEANNIKALYERFNGDGSDPCGPYL